MKSTVVELKHFFSDGRSEFLTLLAVLARNDHEKIPSLTQLQQQLGISVSSLREQMEVARAMGLIEVKPRTGMKLLPYSFRPTIRQTLAYAVATDSRNFELFSDLRNHIEMAYWYQAVGTLTDEDILHMKNLILDAQKKLEDQPIQIPHYEHRELHLTIYRHLDNLFVSGILEAFWELYEEVGYNLYTDHDYLKRVWDYHQKIVDTIESRNYSLGYKLLVEHISMISQRSKPKLPQIFE
jgi:DNA-binding FadR family transcriptional regulator